MNLHWNSAMLGVLMAFMGAIGGATAQTDIPPFGPVFLQEEVATCLLYTSDAADD